MVEKILDAIDEFYERPAVQRFFDVVLAILVVMVVGVFVWMHKEGMF